MKKKYCFVLPGQINDKRIKKKKKLFAICLDKKEKNKYKKKENKRKKRKGFVQFA